MVPATKSAVNFPVTGDVARCRGTLLLPGRDSGQRARTPQSSPGVADATQHQYPERLPAVVLASGFGSTHDRLLDAAQAFADAGFASLAFDYRGFGASEGQPRQVVDLAAQRADLRAAIAFLRGHPAVDPDRIALWGNSLGGGHVVVVAADDLRIRAVIAQIPFNGFPQHVEGRTVGYTLRFLAAAMLDTIRGWLGLSPHLIPLIGQPGEVAITTEAEARAQLASMPPDTLWRNEASPRATLAMLGYRPSDASPRVEGAILVCLAEHDVLPTKQRLLATRARRGEVRTYPGNHFSFYRDPEIRRRIVEDQIEFLREHLEKR
jgi:uncharacterized protein